MALVHLRPGNNGSPPSSPEGLHNNDDPYDWPVERVASEISRFTGPLDEYGKLGQSIRENKVSGRALLTIINMENLKTELDIKPLGLREAVMYQIEQWQQRSQKYLEEDEKKHVREMVRSHRIQMQFKRQVEQLVTGDSEEVSKTPRRTSPLQQPRREKAGSARNWRWLSPSPLPNLGTPSPRCRPRTITTNEYGQTEAAQKRPLEFDPDNDFNLFTTPNLEPLHKGHLTAEYTNDSLTLDLGDQGDHVAAVVPVYGEDSSMDAQLMDVDEKPLMEAQIPESLEPGADRSRRSVTHGPVIPKTPRVLPVSSMRRLSEYSRRKESYLGAQALLVEDIFYGERDIEEDDTSDNFYIPPSDASVGTKRYVEKQIRHFLMSAEQASVVKRNGLHRTAIKPYRASLLRKHYKQSITVYDARGDKCKVYQAKVDDMDLYDLPWDYVSPEKRGNSQKVVFAEDPYAPKRYNYNSADNTEHGFDYLLKWVNIEDDHALPEFGESGSEGEYDVLTWREIEEEFANGGKLPKVILKSRKGGKKGLVASRRSRVEGLYEEDSGDDVWSERGRDSDETSARENPDIDDTDQMDIDKFCPDADPLDAEHQSAMLGEDVGTDAVVEGPPRATRQKGTLTRAVIDLTLDEEPSHPPINAPSRIPKPPKTPKRLFPFKSAYSDKRKRKSGSDKGKCKALAEDPTDHPDDDEEVQPRRHRPVGIVEDVSAITSREDTHRHVKARLKRIRAEEKQRMGAAHDGKIEINRGKYAGENYIFIHPQIAEHLKPHQVNGVRFLWGELVQGKRNKGALLAHTMGLGKTLQIITFLHTVAVAGASSDPKTYKQLPPHMRQSKSVVLCPPGLIDNWWDEFHQWLPIDHEGLDLKHIGQIYKIASNVSLNVRIKTIEAWDKNGGILIISYHMFRQLVHKEESPVKDVLLQRPNIIIADEAHQMKNTHSKLSIATSKFKSTSRIALTGSPLTNSLIEYFAMIDWIDSGYLGPEKEFQIKYARPIEDGLHIDSTRGEKRESLKMLKVLKMDLAPKVQRMDITAIQAFLPPKMEFLITLPLTRVQRELYMLLIQQIREQHYSFFDSTHLLSLVNNHPKSVVKTLQRRTANQTERDIDPDAPQGTTLTASMEIATRTLDAVAELLSSSTLSPGAARHSYRVMALREILVHSKAVGDRVLVFTHSIITLDILGQYMTSWMINYRRLDGKTLISKRQQNTKDFNSGTSDVFLISTRAGGLGLNLPGANRVVIFDFTWNPMWEEQAVGRAYRIGQTKHVFVYRFTAGGTFEDRIRNTTEFKQQLATRVVDEKDPMRVSSKLGKFLLHPPEDPPQQELAEFVGKDPQVLDKMLAVENNYIRAIRYTQTFIEDEDDHLDESEAAEVKTRLETIQRNRINNAQPGDNDTGAQTSAAGVSANPIVADVAEVLRALEPIAPKQTPRFATSYPVSSAAPSSVAAIGKHIMATPPQNVQQALRSPLPNTLGRKSTSTRKERLPFEYESLDEDDEDVSNIIKPKRGLGLGSALSSGTGTPRPHRADEDTSMGSMDDRVSGVAQDGPPVETPESFKKSDIFDIATATATATAAANFSGVIDVAVNGDGGVGVVGEKGKAKGKGKRTGAQKEARNDSVGLPTREVQRPPSHGLEASNSVTIELDDDTTDLPSPPSSSSAPVRAESSGTVSPSPLRDPLPPSLAVTRPVDDVVAEEDDEMEQGDEEGDRIAKTPFQVLQKWRLKTGKVPVVRYGQGSRLARKGSRR